jgi:signal transduction histidine kinase
MDVLLLVVAAELVFHPIGKSLGHKLLIASISMLVIGDEISYVVANQSTASTGGAADLFWLASYVIWGAASIEPQPEAPFVDRRRVPRLTGARLTLLGAGVLSVPIALVVEQATGRSAHAYVAAGGAGAISLLVLIRLRDVVRAIEAQNVRMRELDQLKDDFVASVSHELRTPLTSISGYLDLLEEDAHTFNEEHQSFLRIVNTNTGRLLRLVNDLLIVAGLQARRLDIEISPVDVTALLEHSVHVVAPSARAKGLELTAEIAPKLVVPGDAHRLAQLVDNLLANAIKFTDVGTIRLRGFRSGADVVVVVEDSGIGIPEADQPRVFDRFFRSADAVAQAVQGTGLGLYIARQIADVHGASVSVASRPGEGTTFSVLLPGAETSVGAPDPDAR